MIIRKLSDKKLNIVLIQGSPRDKDTCPGMTGKTKMIADYIVDKWSTFINFKIIDLSVNLDKSPIVQPCKGCVSTAGGIHCHYPCSCYYKGDKKHTDLLHELNVYEYLKTCDAFIYYLQFIGIHYLHK